MQTITQHTFHIPVMGLSFTLDTPIKVAKYGISSVLSIVEDQLIEQMREVICKQEKLQYIPITESEEDSRAKRITAYLNLLNDIVNRQVEEMKQSDFESCKDLNQYFEMLPETSELKRMYLSLRTCSDDERIALEHTLKEAIRPGSIDVNIMTKVDKTNYNQAGEALPSEYSDALSALRGYANSTLHSSVVFSAGLNPRLFSYCDKFDDFFPDEKGYIKKKIILKVSDYRSALIQGKYLAKKGLWVSEFRVESGINCGGHAFISGGVLFGQILDDFKNKREELVNELFVDCNAALSNLNRNTFKEMPVMKITAQGGIGNASENNFLLENYGLDATGWGSPFLLVPEATTVDDDTLQKLATAKKEDYYLSHASPLGVPFNNFRPSSSEAQRKHRIQKNRPGSPCFKRFLAFNTEFTEKSICTGSRQYQKLKIEELQASIHDEVLLQTKIAEVTEKDCLCEGLGASALLKNDAQLSHHLSAVTICPGPNLAYFSGTFSLQQMIDHIYGRTNILNSESRSNLFINELKLYVQYFLHETINLSQEFEKQKGIQLGKFKNNLLTGIEYYKQLANNMELKAKELFNGMIDELNSIENVLQVAVV